MGGHPLGPFLGWQFCHHRRSPPQVHNNNRKSGRFLLDHLLPVCLAALAAGLIQGLSGFGSVLVALPLLVFFLDLRLAVPLVSIWGMTINLMLLKGLWRQVQMGRIVPLTLAALPGIPLGVYLLRQVPVRLLEFLLGAILIGFAAYFLLSRGRTRALGRGWEILAGFLSGCLGGSLAASGPPVIIYSALQPWGKDAIKATLTGYFALSGLIILAVQAWHRLFTRTVLLYGVFSIPFIFLGVIVGLWFYRRLDTSRYRQVIIGLITLLGLLTLGKAWGGS